VFAYVFEGAGTFAAASDPQPVKTDVVGQEGVQADNRSLVLFDAGDEITVETRDDGVRFLLVSGTPLQEPVAWRGPIVMNTNDELRQAFEEYRNGTFLRHA
jgi:hypothetical protein